VLNVVVGEARAAGTYDKGVADLRASSVYLQGAPEEVARDPATGAVTTLARIVLDRGVSWEQALAKVAEAGAASVLAAARGSGHSESTDMNEGVKNGTLDGEEEEEEEEEEEQ
ncbi:unnamed protein product, partial [Discosporangium mesarthrocarpum]